MMRRPIYMPSCSTDTMAVLLRRHREAVLVAGRGRRQYDVEMAEQRGVFAFAREGRTCDPLLDLEHLG
jgi:hypothetical protein